MQFILFIIALLPFLALFIAAFFVNIFLHELGHATPILFWTKQKVSIYVGSFGDNRRSFRCQIGKLEIFITYNPFRWIKGLCKPHETFSVRQRVFYIAMGPLTSLSVLLISWSVLRLGWTGLASMAITVTLLVALLCTIGSAIPSQKIHFTHAGRPIQNDATQLIQLWKARNTPPEYWEANEHVKNGQWAEASSLLDKAITNGCLQAPVLRLAVTTHLNNRNYARAGELSDVIRKRHGLIAEDHVNNGYRYSMLKDHSSAMECYARALEMKPDDLYALNNVGYSLIVLDTPDKAIPYFQKIIQLSPRFAVAHNNLGWARMKIGEWEMGLKDVRHALQLDDKLADAYSSLGYYYLEMGHTKEALEHFTTARTLDANLPMIDEYLAETHRRLKIEPLPPSEHAVH